MYRVSVFGMLTSRILAMATESIADVPVKNIMKLNNVLPSIPILLRESQRDKAKNETNRPIILFHFKSLTKN